MYFPGDPLFPYDPVMNSVTDEQAPVRRRPTLIGEATAEGVRFDIRLQGEDETVFFDV